VVSGLQRRDAEALQGIIALMSLGGLTYAVKELIAGRTPSSDPKDIILNGITRSGIAGLMGEAALSYAFPYSPKYVGRSIIGNALGPSVSVMENIFQLPYAIGDGEISQKDFNRMQRLVPLQNLFWLRLVLNQAFGENNDS